ncbi:MAG: hypothetical protein Q8L20_10710 [Gammaproteobacteria bacterium]|nr:hypothetical protein [Gammaproteobacteria bacterium]
MQRYGPLNVNRELERGFAMLAMVFNRSMGGDSEMKNYMPYSQKRKKKLSLKDAMESWK